MRLLCFAVCVVSASAACGGPRASGPARVTSAWRLRLDVDSAPGAVPRARSVMGSVAPDLTHYDIDLEPLLGRSLPSRMDLAVIKQTDTVDGVSVEIMLGDPTSDRNKLVLRSQSAWAAAGDSLAGHWVDPGSCCGTGGRFTLWRASH